MRFLELDVHDNDFGVHGYRVGHDGPGDEVDRLAGSPEGDEVDDWLEAIDDWSDNHSGHGPITIAIDLKDDLTDNHSYGEGNLARLNALLKAEFGTKLYRADTLGSDPWPTVASLMDRIIVVLSGDETTRLGYRRDRGDNPAVAMNSRRQIVEVHDSGSGRLWYWTGQMSLDGSVRWIRHGRYDTGKDPAVALSDSGTIVEVHEDPDLGDHKLWYRVGQLTPDYEIEWVFENGQSFPGNDSGVDPSV